MNEFEFEQDRLPQTRIKVIGVGGGGCNAVDSMVGMGLPGVEFFAVNTDTQALENSKCPNKIHIGSEVTHGMGAGGDPKVGEAAAVAERDLLAGAIEGGDMVFITACLGGGTGTGAAPVVAELAKSMGLLTVAVVTKPFQFEGPQRKARAQQGIDRLREYVDALIVVMNDKLVESVGPKTSLLEAFGMVNNILAQGVKSISDLIGMPGLVNADFQDVRAVMGQTGKAVLGFGVGKGENRASEALKKACSATLQEKIVIDGARSVLVSVAGSPDMTLHEIREAISPVYENADPEANIIFSAVIDPRLSDEISITIIATGFPEDAGVTKLSSTPLGAREKTPAPPARPKAASTSPGASALAAEFGPAAAGALADEFERNLPERPSEKRSAGTGSRAGNFPPPPAAADDMFESGNEEAEEPAASKPLQSWEDDEPEAVCEPEPPAPMGSRPFARLSKERDELAAAPAPRPESKAEADAEENLDIPTIIRRRRSFFS